MMNQILRPSGLTGSSRSFLRMLLSLSVLFAAVILLAWNEGSAVKTAAELREGTAEVVRLGDGKSKPDHNKLLVHLSGEASCDSVLKDPFFKIGGRAIKFRRTVEVFQWKEISNEETKSGSRDRADIATNYSYEKVWSEKLILSRDFHDSNHKNPSSLPLQSLLLTAEPVTVGDFTLNSDLVEQMDRFEIIPGPPVLPKGYVAVGDAIYHSAHPDFPEIGCLRITFSLVKAAEVSVIAQQQDEDLQPYVGKTGTTINMLTYGNVSAEQMFSGDRQNKVLLPWGMRALGLITLWVGSLMILSPVGIPALVLPSSGNAERFEISLLALASAISLGLLTIGLAWLAYRPLFASGLLVLALAIPITFLLRKSWMAILFGPKPSHDEEKHPLRKF